MRLEHVNVSVPDPRATAAVLSELFDWKVRWEGPALGDGFTVHVGDDSGYLALYAPAEGQTPIGDTYHLTGGLNHIGVEVDDLAKVEARVKAKGYVPHSHADYEPGQRFYFDGPDGIEFEVVAYD
ncbi:MAG: VOC family protein [Marinibacterium profundimaris]